MIKVRSMSKEDEPFIFATYLKNNWYSGKLSTTLKKDTWMRVQHGRLEALFANAPEQVKVVCLEEDHNTILGYRLQDFIYIRPQWRSIANIEGML